MPTIAIRIPAETDTKTAKTLLVDALDSHLSVENIALANTTSAKISVNAVQLAQLEKLARQHRLGVSDVVSRLIMLRHSELKRSVNKAAIHTLDRLIDQGRIDHRPGQGTMTAALRNVLTRKDVLVAEAPTGSGKTMASLCAAVDAFEQHGERIVIAVPTIHLMHQIEAEYRVIQAIHGVPEIGYIIGRNNFVSVDSLMGILENPEYSALVGPAMAWVSAQQDRLGDALSSLQYQARDLYDAVPGIPPCEIESGSAESDAGVMAYRAQFARARHTGLLVVTHSMLALDAKLKLIKSMQAAKAEGVDWAKIKELHAVLVQDGSAEEKGFYTFMSEQYASYDVTGILPPFCRLIVDEVHKLEQSFASMTSDTLSLHTIIADKDLSDSARTKLRKLFDELVDMGRDVGGDRIDLPLRAQDLNGPRATEILIGMRGILSKARKGKGNVRLRRVIKTLGNIIDNIDRNGYQAQVDFSPIYLYPRLRCGATAVYRYMLFMWSQLSSGAAVSATILLPSQQGALSSSYAMLLLSIPAGRILPPVHIPVPDWLISPVTVFTPNPVRDGDRYWLQPPSRKSNLSKEEHQRYQRDHQAWIAEIAESICAIADSAAGGTLVLITSYDDVDHLTAALDGRLDGRLVLADREISQIDKQRDYEQLYSDGVRPAWLAIMNGAGTGLNLSAGGNALDDLLLTDLVIPRLPMGSNQTITHETRVARLGFPIVISEALMSFKQALGRLVRRNGIKNNRRLYLLDSRPYTSDAQWTTAIFRGMELLLAGYAKKTLSREDVAVRK